jgi:hypothetical protein
MSSGFARTSIVVGELERPSIDTAAGIPTMALLSRAGLSGNGSRIPTTVKFCPPIDTVGAPSRLTIPSAWAAVAPSTATG